jgi:hypothetical protein
MKKKLFQAIGEFKPRHVLSMLQRTATLSYIPMREKQEPFTKYFSSRPTQLPFAKWHQE